MSVIIKRLKASVDVDNWVRCGECMHKLMRVVSPGYADPPPIIEIKCHSCKTINTWSYDYWHGREKGGFAEFKK